MHVSLIIPAYNEERRIAPFLDSIAIFIKQHPATINEIIVVDDGSSDRTSQVVQAYQNRISQLKLITLPINQGKGAAIQTGVMQAKGEYIVFTDADGATPISELPKMVKALQQADIAIGNRWMRGAKTTRHSYVRRLAGWTYRTYMSLFGLGQIDTMSGFKGYRQQAAKDLFSQLQEKRWLFDTEITYCALQEGYTIANFPISWESKDGSKLSTSTLITSAWKIWPLIQSIKRSCVI
jgi:glycosyltransferase involved in cell wall biosynthesis